jgi:hypothetical protein
VKDNDVESFRHCCALMIRLTGISERRLGHSQPHDQCPPTTSSTYSTARRRPTTINWLAPPIRARGQTGMGDSVPFRWTPVGVNPTQFTAFSAPSLPVIVMAEGSLL